MPKRNRRKSKSGDKGVTGNWKAGANDGTKPKIFDPSAASLRKNREYLELKREIALKGKVI